MSTGPSGKPTLQAQIDENLRRIFDEDLEDGLPDRLRDLVDQLDGLSASKSDDDDDQSGGGSGSVSESGDTSDDRNGPTKGANGRAWHDFARAQSGGARRIQALDVSRFLEPEKVVR